MKIRDGLYSLLPVAFVILSGCAAPQETSAISLSKNTIASLWSSHEIESTDLARLLPLDRGTGRADKPSRPSYSSLVQFLGKQDPTKEQAARELLWKVYDHALAEDITDNPKAFSTNGITKNMGLDASGFKAWHPADYWSIVSFRFDPCAIAAPLPPEVLRRPLPERRASEAVIKSFGSALCVPQVRLVAQPMLGNHLMPDGRRGLDTDDKALHLTFDLVDFHHDAVADMKVKEAISESDLISLAQLHMEHAAEVRAAQASLHDLAQRLASEPHLRVKSRGSGFAEVSRSFEVEAPADVYLSALLPLLSQIADFDKLTEVAFMFSNIERDYSTAGWAFGALSVSKAPSGARVVSPVRITTHHLADEGIKKVFDLGHIENFFNGVINLSESGLSYGRALLDEGLANVMATSLPSSYIQDSTVESYLHEDSKDTEVFETMTKQILPVFNNRHSASCASCHFGEAVVPLLLQQRKIFRKELIEGQFGYEDYEGVLAALPVGRKGATGMLKMDREKSASTNAATVVNMPMLSFGVSRSFGYFSETAHCSMRAFAEISAATDIFNNIRDDVPNF